MHPHVHGVARRACAVVVALPDRVPALLLWTTVVCTLTAVAGVMRPAVVVPLLLIVVVSTWRAVPPPLPRSRAAVGGAAAASALAAVWVLVQAPYASQYVVVDRDPGFITLRAMWLGAHGTPSAPLGGVADVADLVDGIKFTSSSLTQSGDALQVQGATGLPALLGAGTWVAGDRAALLGNLVVAAVGLLAVYALARRLVGPLWGLLPVVALATSSPLAVFSRAAYTEPLTMALLFLALTAGYAAYSTRRLDLFALTGAALGATSLVRIDGGASVAGAVVAMSLAAALTTPPAVRRRLLTGLAVATVLAVGLSFVGYLDLELNSRQYRHALDRQIVSLRTALVLTIAACGLLLLLVRRRAALAFASRTTAWARAAGISVALLAAVLVSRPVWLVARNTRPNSPYGDTIAGMQERQGLPIDRARSYDELTVDWLALYHGWPAIVLAFAGLTAIAVVAVRRRDPRLLLFLGVVAAPSALYLWSVSITADQIWAMRRLLPVTIPGFLVAATWVVAAVWRTRPRWTSWLAPPAAALVAFFPLTTWSGLFTVVEHDNRYPQLHAVCETLTSDRVLLVNAGGPPYIEPLRLGCGVEVAAVYSLDSPEQARRIVDAWGGGPVDVVAFAFDTVPWVPGTPDGPLVEITTRAWERTLNELPDDYTERDSSVWVGTVNPDGTVSRLP